MRKLFCIVSSVMLFVSLAVAQSSLQQVETFERSGGSWGWQEFTHTKNQSAVIQNGQLVIKSKKRNKFLYGGIVGGLVGDLLYKGNPTIITTQFPVDVDRNFKITTRILLPKYKKGEPVFGMVFDVGGVDGFLITSNKNAELITAGAREKRAFPFKIGKKNAVVTIDIENRGGYLSFDVNGIAVFTDIEYKFTTSTLGFVATEGEIRVVDVVVHQIPKEQNEED
jgi:hypothetical protein